MNPSRNFFEQEAHFTVNVVWWAQPFRVIWRLEIIKYLRNLYAGQEATIRTGHVTVNWFKVGKEMQQGCILSLYKFKLYAEYNMQNDGLAELQAGIKIARRNTNNLI